MPHTNGSAIRGASNYVILELQVFVEDGGVELYLAVEFLAKLLPVCSGIHGYGFQLILQFSNKCCLRSGFDLNAQSTVGVVIYE